MKLCLYMKSVLPVASCVLLSSAIARADGPVRNVASIATANEPAAGGSAPAAEPETETLLSGKLEHGGYGAPEVKGTPILGQGALLVGLQGGWLINHSLIVGIAGYGLVTSHDAPTALQTPDGETRLRLGYGGFRAGYVFAPRSLVHASASLLLGAGSVGAMHGRFDERAMTGTDTLYAVEPQAEIELNLARYVRLAASASYRYLGDVDTPGLSSSNLSGPAGGLLAKFGLF